VPQQPRGWSLADTLQDPLVDRVDAVAAHPGLDQAVVLGIEEEDPRRVLDHQRLGLLVEGDALVLVGGREGGGEQAVELGVPVAGDVGAGRGQVVARELGKEVLGVRVVGEPGQAEERRLAALDRRQVLGPGELPHLDPHADAPELRRHRRGQLDVRRAPRVHQELELPEPPALGVAGLGEESAPALEVEAVAAELRLTPGGPGRPVVGGTRPEPRATPRGRPRS
jgi:hypothetical protein